MAATLQSKMGIRIVACAAVALATLYASSSIRAWAQSAAEVKAPDGKAAEETLVDEQLIPTQSLWDMLIAGGVLMIPICGCSFILLIFTFERLLSLRKRNVIPGPFVTRFMEQLREGQLDRESAVELCEENESPISRVFAAACRKWGKPAVEVEQAVLDEGERASNGLGRYLRVINGVATVSPLLGLLGTVWGMMASFNVIATSAAMGKPELLAGGISEALVTTAAGLFVAIPALTIYMFFGGRVDGLIMEIDALGQELVNMISAEALQERPLGKAARTKKAA
jgi:biopolymer transport protein ExbB